MYSDYTTVGHVTVDVMADGSCRPGGGAFYSALQAARLGRSVQVVTRGVRAEIERLLLPYMGEFELHVIEAPCTTTLATLGEGRERGQRMLAWAGEIGPDVAIDTAILHVAPVARETPSRWRGRARFVGVTPQGLVRDWSHIGAPIVPRMLDPELMPERCDAIVFSRSERDACARLLEPARAAAITEAQVASGQALGPGSQPLVAVTAGAEPAELHLPGGEIVRVPAARVDRARDDVGAGDVFAAALFVSLADGAAPRAAARFAHAAAAVRIAGEGADAIGDRAAIEARAGASG